MPFLYGYFLSSALCDMRYVMLDYYQNKRVKLEVFAPLIFVIVYMQYISIHIARHREKYAHIR